MVKAVRCKAHGVAGSEKDLLEVQLEGSVGCFTVNEELLPIFFCSTQKIGNTEGIGRIGG